MIYFYPYKNGSRSLKALRELLSSKSVKSLEIKVENSKFVGSEKKRVVNWGSSRRQSEVTKANLLNNFDAVALASNKLLTFNALRGHVSIPEYSEDEEDAMAWLKEDSTVFARTTLNGHSGAGIVEINKGDPITDAPLYVRYIKKKEEYRVHVFRNPDGTFEARHVQRKARKLGVPDDQVNWKIRNLANGFIFASDNVGPVPTSVVSNAVEAVHQLGLDFGAVDVIYNDKQKQAYVLEVNTAPGLEGRTLEVYSEYISSWR